MNPSEAAVLILPGAIPEEQLAERDAYGQPLRADSWYWARVSREVFGSGLPYFVPVTGPVSPLTLGGN